MAYVTGTSTTLANLLTDIRSACTANGWTLSGSVLHKGAVYQSLAVSGNFIDSVGGTGKDGSNNLTGMPGTGTNCRIGSLSSGPAPFVFPLTYHVLIGTAPDEVVVVVNYSTDKYQWLAWGQSSITTLGTGAWFGGSFQNVSSYSSISISIAASPTAEMGTRGGASTQQCCPALFHATTAYGTTGEAVNHGAGTTVAGWSVDVSGSSPTCGSTKYRAPLDYCLPSAWNSETVLLPIQIFTNAYGSSKVAMVVDVAHARAVRIDNHQPGDIITLGADRWMVFPWYHKSASESSTSTGRLGWAIRYDGP
jgi:hypothetical protein